MIRNNACYKVAGPCILVYDDYNRGRNFIVGNYAILSGTNDFGIQCTSGVTVTNNVVLHATNNVLYCGNQASITSSVNLAGYQIYNNAVNGPMDASGIQSTGTFNVESNVFFDPNKMDLYPAVGSPLINAGVHINSQLVTYDFNGNSRSNSKPTVGAYVS
ncbi:unnamed protein product [Rotaria sp. Silwood2]|nr:unnamed protein product [Rotaria sp. Silwood2]CAF4235889.1 unnamed protein product [Rotaria sp. Silwood2]CAF4425739.1 unnamed protein product [Rotaria sp. Silwood2]